ncbi:tetratricopeptide repeat protein [Kangiella sp. HZ709]|uniref:tetratricopeptide repeat protein n=1 Tax=Kangiella sp. HZ709 TaxID=2666328 RepID=UPI0012B15ADD|nr:tetratricopeptide repeat protein [Kangiella sp. HZ709]MRX26863.1 tetratricopeptide repeat protein [Kangiella sp. HZ709]
MNNKELQTRRDALLTFLKQDPSNTSIIRELIGVNYHLGNSDDALSLIEKLESTGSASEDIIFQKSNILLAQGKPDKVVALLENYKFSEQAHNFVTINLAHANFQLGNFETVDEALTAINFYPEPSVYSLHARSLHHLGELDKAVIVLEKGLAKFNDETSLQGLMSLISFDNGSYSQASLDYAEQALTKDPNQIESLLAAGMLNQQHLKELVKAEEYFDKAVEMHPHVGRGWLYKGLALMMKKDLVTAESFLEKACSLMPEHIGSWHSLGWNFLLQNRVADARACYETAMDIDRNFGETHGGLSIVEALEGKYEEAERTARVALRLDPNSFSAQYTLMILAESDKNQEKVQSIVSNVFNTEQGKEALDFINTLQK